VRLSGRSEDGPFPVFGRKGGDNGRGSGMWINDKTVEHGVYRRLEPNDRVRFIISGGGGYEPAYLREPARVLSDVQQGYVSIESAKIDYGVVINITGMTIDFEATQTLRDSII
jgi:N-methylhydantoinase B